MPSPTTPPKARIQPLPRALHKLQHYLYQTHLSPSSTCTQSSLFTYYAPLTILLSIFFLPHYVDLSPSPSTSNSTSTTSGLYRQILEILAHLLLGACAGLLALRVVIWVGARMVWAFCELDLEGREAEKICGESGESGVDGDGEMEMEMELTQGNLILGGLFG